MSEQELNTAEQSGSILSVNYSGEAIRDGKIDIRDLSASLDSFGSLISHANELLNDKGTDVSVKVSAFREGSFEVNLVIDLSNTVFNHSLINVIETTSKDLLYLLFGSAGVAGVFDLILKLKGKKPRAKTVNKNNVNVHIGDNIYKTDRKADSLLADKKIRHEARNLVAPLKNDRIEKISISIANETSLEITKSDVHSFASIAENDDILSDKKSNDDETGLLDDTRTMNLQIVSLNFKSTRGWKFTDGESTFSATIADVEFFKKIDSDEISFAMHDYLVCSVHEKQEFKKSRLVKTRTIVEVHKHIPVPDQPTLFSESN